VNTVNNGAPLHTGSVLGLTACKDTVFSCSDDKRICRFDWSGQASPLYFVGHERAVNRVVAAGSHLWSVSRDLSLRQWDLETASPLQTIAKSHELNVSAVAVQHGGSKVFTGSRDYHVKGWDIATGKCSSTFSCPRNIVTALEFDATSASDHLLYQGSEDLCVRVWDARSSIASTPTTHITGFVYFPLCIAMHTNGTTMATGCKGFNAVGCEVKLWDLRKVNKPIIEFTGHTQDVTACKFSCCGSMLLSVSKDGSVCSWDVKSSVSKPLSQLSTDKILSSLTAHDSSVSEMLFSTGCFDGSLVLLTLDAAGTIKVRQATEPGFVIDGYAEAEAASRIVQT